MAQDVDEYGNPQTPVGQANEKKRNKNLTIGLGVAGIGVAIFVYMRSKANAAAAQSTASYTDPTTLASGSAPVDTSGYGNLADTISSANQGTQSQLQALSGQVNAGQASSLDELVSLNKGIASLLGTDPSALAAFNSLPSNAAYEQSLSSQYGVNFGSYTGTPMTIPTGFGSMSGNPSPPTISPTPAPAPAPTPPPPAPAPQQQTYTVKSGDTLSGIGARFGVPWQNIYNANQGVIGGNPNLIYPGQVYNIP